MHKNKDIKKNTEKEKLLKELIPYIRITFQDVIKIVLGWSIVLAITMLRPIVISRLTDEGLVKTDLKALCFWSGSFLFISIIEYWGELVQTITYVNINNRFVTNLYQSIFEKIMKIPAENLQKRQSAEIFHTISMDIGKVSLLVDRNNSF